MPLLALFLVLLIFSPDVAAHIKWFEPFDVTESPKRVDLVFSKTYVRFFLSSLVFIFLFFWLDRHFYRKRIAASFIEKVIEASPTPLSILRFTTIVFFLSLFGYGVVGKSFLLTPEMTTDNQYVMWLHLAVALAALHRGAFPIVGLSLISIWILGFMEYGLFHLLDYTIFLALAYFFLANGSRNKKIIKSGSVVLYASFGLNLGWLSIEKWAYPHWTYPLLQENPEILFGIPQEIYMILAGFVEFNIAFMMLGSVSPLSRIVALGLATIFTLAIFQFGLIDAVGHLFILAILIILTLRGPTHARYFLALSDKSKWTEAYFMTGLWVLALVMIFLAYYGFHYLIFDAA